MHKFPPYLALCMAGLLTLTPANAKQDKPMNRDQKDVLATVSSMTEAFHDGNLDRVTKRMKNLRQLPSSPDRLFPTAPPFSKCFS